MSFHIAPYLVAGFFPGLTMALSGAIINDADRRGLPVIAGGICYAMLGIVHGFTDIGYSIVLALTGGA